MQFVVQQRDAARDAQQQASQVVRGVRHVLLHTGVFRGRDNGQLIPQPPDLPHKTARKLTPACLLTSTDGGTEAKSKNAAGVGPMTICL